MASLIGASDLAWTKRGNLTTLTWMRQVRLTTRQVRTRTRTR